MQLAVADEVARSLIQERLPRHWRWKLQYHNSVNIWGWCFADTRVISLSRPLIRCNKESLLREVVLHEVAHAIVDNYHGTSGHNQTWKKIAIALGASGHRLVFNSISPPPRFEGQCQHCGNTDGSHKRYLVCKFCPTWGIKPRKCPMTWTKHRFWESL